MTMLDRMWVNTAANRFIRFMDAQKSGDTEAENMAFKEYIRYYRDIESFGLLPEFRKATAKKIHDRNKIM